MTYVQQIAGGSPDRSGRSVPIGRPAVDKAPIPATVLGQPVMVIEDEAIIAWMVEDFLETLGFETILVASSGEQAIEIAGGAAPALIVSDINLGATRLDGVGANARITASRPTPVLFITGHASADAILRIDAFPRSRILNKPVALDDVRRGILGILAEGAAS